MIDSMTIEERKNPDLINTSRKNRIAKGSGKSIQELNAFLKQFEQMREMMKQMNKMGGMGMKFPGMR
jgi:signal recognition particle subunit SRP54